MGFDEVHCKKLTNTKIHLYTFIVLCTQMDDYKKKTLKFEFQGK